MAFSDELLGLKPRSASLLSIFTTCHPFPMANWVYTLFKSGKVYVQQGRSLCLRLDTRKHVLWGSRTSAQTD